MRENDLRDYLFEKHKTSLLSLVRSRVKPVATGKEAFPRISELLCARIEAKIDEMVEQLELLTLQGKEVRLVRDDDSSTRIDLLGHLEGYGDLVIIKLTNSDQTERQSFTELLAYANHFCTLFPSLSETSFMSVLIAPMQGRGVRDVRDSLAQELIVNGKNTLGLIPKFDGDKPTLTPCYPNDQLFDAEEGMGGYGSGRSGGRPTTECRNSSETSSFVPEARVTARSSGRTPRPASGSARSATRPISARNRGACG